ncbi:MAG: PorV/PorQ family protein [Bacteroidales bacterium]|nr:PorV/PorQ family protein [Bacteroidales bacterium]
MKKSFRYIVMSLVLLLGVSAPQAFAGNEDRSGQAGAPELLINPWAASSGWGNAGMSFVKGVEAMYGNVAGISAIRGLDINFTHTDWLKGTGVKISSFGLCARVGESSVLGLSFMSFNIGEIMETTTTSPDGGIGTFKPNLMNINVAFAKTFSNSISGGFNLKIISESIANMSCTGVALDAGIQYVTGPFDNIHFGITLKNIGPTMTFSGDGLSIKAFLLPNSSLQHTVIQRADQFELPTQLSIAAAYDWHFAEEMRMTFAANFISNSFTKDQYVGGLEFSWREMFLLRAGYTYESGLFSGILDENCLNLNRGLNAGCSVQVPIAKREDAPVFAVDYSFRQTYSYGGTHSFGARLIF